MLLALDCTAQDKDEYAIQIGSYESKIELFAPVGHAMIKNCSLSESLLRVIDGGHSLKSDEQSSAKL